MRIVGLDHLQIAIPRGSEEQARSFYVGVLGLEEIPKPAELAGRGGLWLRCGAQQLHLGIEDDFRPARKAHPGIVIDGLGDLAALLESSGHDITAGESLPGLRRLFVNDPFGNRIEFLEYTTAQL